jgi:hypothetical protein
VPPEADKPVKNPSNRLGMANLVFRPIRVTDKVLKEKVRKAWLEFYSLKALFHRLGLSWGKIRLFIWLVNLALCFYTRKKLKWN